MEAHRIAQVRVAHGATTEERVENTSIDKQATSAISSKEEANNIDSVLERVESLQEKAMLEKSKTACTKEKP